jgi:beta-ureidopropionase / N-carbamoyl-L-amino-acid hydrolase
MSDARIEPGALAERLEGVASIGRGAHGTTRLAWTEEDAAAAVWFRAQACATGLSVERDPAGNLWATPDSPPPWWALGSHLDSVRSGGPFDGALGVVAGFEIAARAEVPVAVISFADEEGARFNTPTFGSRALTGALDSSVLGRRDRDGVRLADAMRDAGVDPDGLERAPEWIERLRGFVELHIDQSTELARAGRTAGVVRGLVARLRLRAELQGRADHSGTTPPGERRDALAAAARLIVAALDGAGDGLVATASRIEVEPNALTTVPAHASVWLDARAPDAARVDAWRAGLERAAQEIGAAAGVPIALTVESQNEGSSFDPDLRARLVALSAELGRPAPELDCYAGHDAGLLASRLPAAMVLVRNESGVSHSPEERVELDDAAYGAELVLRLLEELAR